VSSGFAPGPPFYHHISTGFFLTSFGLKPQKDLKDEEVDRLSKSFLPLLSLFGPVLLKADVWMSLFSDLPPVRVVRPVCVYLVDDPLDFLHW